MMEKTKEVELVYRQPTPEQIAEYEKILPISDAWVFDFRSTKTKKNKMTNNNQSCILNPSAKS